MKVVATERPYAMDCEAPEFEGYEARFRALAETVEAHEGLKPVLTSVRLYLCLYGENGLRPPEELAMLAELEATPKAQLRKLEIEADYWQELVLFIP
jgi:hypothetical protein